MKEVIFKPILTPENFVTNLRSGRFKVPFGNGEKELFNSSGFTVINPQLKTEVYDQLKSNFKSTLYSPNQDITSHFVGGFSKMDS